MRIGQIAFVFLFGAALLGQTAATSSGAANHNADGAADASAQPSGRQSPQATDDLAQMRIDLDRMESLNTNMSSEIEFLRDQNLQILLRTNSQMWTILIRDLRRRIDLDQERSLTQPRAPGTQNPAPQPSPR
ncbi:MAG: hypothetical protein WCC87_22800 [Candidatus Korobacteraceae bacterium]